MRLPFYCLGIFFFGFIATSAHAEPLTKGRTVVVLVGLPGDLESENTFTDETRALLEQLEEPGSQPEKVLLLSNLSTLPDLKTAYPLVRLDNKRDTFLSVAERWKESEEMAPLFIVFGHGGNQGSTPVFHVPGPRLNPADFEQVAQTTPGSTWLLFFPGSSQFAAAIQAPHRTILATEADQVFNVDPISFELFLALLKSSDDLAVLGPDLGAATEHWYSSRSQARTEEPAVWVNGQAPRKLIQPSRSASDESRMMAEQPAPSPDTSNPTASTAATPAQNPPETAPTPPVAQAGDAWKNVHPVSARDYPKADAVLLSRHESYVLDDTEQLIQEEETFLQILTREGKQYGDFNFSFSPADEDLSFPVCEVRRPDGQIEAIDEDEIHDGTTDHPETGVEEKHKIFSLPHAEPGAVIHLLVRHAWKRFPLPHFFSEIPLSSDYPILNFSLEVSIPEKSAFHYRFCYQEAIDPLVSHTNYGTVYRWQFENISGQPSEPLTPENETPFLAVTTFPDWGSFGDWYRRLILESNLTTPELVSQAKELTRDAKTDEEKIAAIAQFVTGFRYVAVPLGVNSFRPHAAANVLKNHFGDCKDKANLLNTLLDALGFKTSLVLVPRFAQAYDDLPGFAFNHAISDVQVKGKPFWIDSTDDVCRLGLLPPGDGGRKVLVVNDPANKLTGLPQTAAQDHQFTLQTTLEVTDPTARVAKANLEVHTHGYADYLMRAAAQNWAARDRLGPLLDIAFSPSSGIYKAEQQSATDVADLTPEFSWSSEGRWTGLMSALPKSTLRLMRAPFWLPREWAVATLPRVSPLELNEGFPMKFHRRLHDHIASWRDALGCPHHAAGDQQRLLLEIILEAALRLRSGSDVKHCFIAGPNSIRRSRWIFNRVVFISRRRCRTGFTFQPP